MAQEDELHDGVAFATDALKPEEGGPAAISVAASTSEATVVMTLQARLALTQARQDSGLRALKEKYTRVDAEEVVVAWLDAVEDRSLGEDFPPLYMSWEYNGCA